MKKLVFIIFLLSTTILFSNNDGDQIKFNTRSYSEFKASNKYQIELKKIFKRPIKKSILEGTILNDLMKKFPNSNYISLKIKHTNDKVNELKISFTKSSLAIKYVLD